MEGREEEEAQEALDAKGVKLRFKRLHRYLGGFYGGRDNMEEWLLTKVVEWAETIETLGVFAVRYPQTAYSGLAMSLQAECKYLMWTILGVGD